MTLLHPEVLEQQRSRRLTASGPSRRRIAPPNPLPNPDTASPGRRAGEPSKQASLCSLAAARRGVPGDGGLGFLGFSYASSEFSAGGGCWRAAQVVGRLAAAGYWPAGSAAEGTA